MLVHGSQRSCPWLSPHQVLARIWRPGTTAQRVVTYRLLTTGSLEEKVHLAHTLRTYSVLTTHLATYTFYAGLHG